VAFSPTQLLGSKADTQPPLPEIPDLADIYADGIKFREGDLMMIVGRSGSQKTGLALWLCAQWSMPTLYFAADSTPADVASRLIQTVCGETQEQVEVGLQTPHRRKWYMEQIADVPISVATGSPITDEAIEEELNAYVELHDAWPKILVIDNLMDMEGAEADWSSQTQAIQMLSTFREAGMTVIMLHHARETEDDGYPPPKWQISNKLDKKPTVILGISLNQDFGTLRIAPLKVRTGKSDPTGRAINYVLAADPARTRFHRKTTTHHH